MSWMELPASIRFGVVALVVACTIALGRWLNSGARERRRETAAALCMMAAWGTFMVAATTQVLSGMNPAWMNIGIGMAQVGTTVWLSSWMYRGLW